MDASVQLVWILRQDSETRALQYFVGYQRKQLRDADWFLEEKDWDEEHVAARLAVESLLSRSPYYEVNEEFEATRKRRKGREPKWHEVDGGPQSFAQMVEECKLYPGLKMLWGQYSNQVHASTLELHTEIDEGELFIDPIRNIEEVRKEARVTLSLSFPPYEAVCKRAIPKHLVHLIARYKSMSKKIDNAPKVVINRARKG